MKDNIVKRIPTGIASLDPVLNGGVPPGSVILLTGEPGAGNREFVYSSVIFLSKLKEKGEEKQGVLLPEEIIYTTFTRLPSSIIEEMELSFKGDITSGAKEKIKFLDLSDIYFESSVVPTGWYSNTSIIERFQKKPISGGIVSKLAEKLEESSKNSLIVLDSITDIATENTGAVEWKQLIGFLRGIQRVSKTWGSVIYVILSEGILSDSRLVEIADCCDAMMTFRWEESSGRKRQRIMYFEKFRGVMPHLEENDLVKFAARITPESGFEVSNIRVVI
ncbi:MAG: ATPase domain-containing protein [Methanomicrobium sp.]|nr:ATPase domain-containing protein [Methanomicrobium sp.]